jgi:hypothetical protein
MPLHAMNGLALAYRNVGRLPEALALHEEAWKGFKDRFGPDHFATLGSLNHLVRACDATDRPARTEPLARQALAVFEQKTPNDWRTFEIRSLLGGSLLGQGKYAEAEPLLIQGYEGMKAREATMPAPLRKHVAEAGARVVRLFEASGQKDRAAEWRRELDRAKAVDRGTKPPDGPPPR